ncbi:MAG: tRNA (cytidine(34)-2'-O)-methyltransferase [Desulfatibacillaceae bacterium]
MFESGTERHVVLVGPEIHWNTGNAGRTCLGAGACLHLVRPLGFSLDAREVRRAGLDYWHEVPLRVWDSLPDLIREMDAEPDLAVFTKTGRSTLWELPRRDRLFLVFGSETRGLPADVLNRYADRTYRIPVTSKIRSLNLSTAVGVALYESIRGRGPTHGWDVM